MRTSVNYLKSVSEKHVYHKISGENEKQGHEINISIANENTAFIFGNQYDKEDNDINNGDDDGTKYEIQKNSVNHNSSFRSPALDKVHGFQELISHFYGHNSKHFPLKRFLAPRGMLSSIIRCYVINDKD